MAQLVLTAGRVALTAARAALPTLGRIAASAAINSLLPGREGPRLLELPVQTSTDGAAMPQVWGRARLAGQVIWAARFTEHAQTSGGGKSGPKETGFTYSLSLPSVCVKARFPGSGGSGPMGHCSTSHAIRCAGMLAATTSCPTP